MEVFNYKQFINENVSMKIFYSQKFRDLINLIKDKSDIQSVKLISEIILKSENNDESKDLNTMIDITDKNDKISFIQANRIERKYPDIDLSTIDSDRISNGFGVQFWSEGRTKEYSIGRWVNHIITKVNKETLNDQDLEIFVNFYKSQYDINYKDINLKLYKGEDIRKYYLQDNYYEIKGQLGNSCMRYSNCQEYFDIYVENPEVCNLLVLLNPDGKVKGRSLIWILKNGDRVMDNIYTIEPSDVQLFEEWCDNNNTKRIYKYINSDDLVVVLNVSNFSYFPYMDNLSRFSASNSTLSYYDSTSSDVITLNSTDGDYEEIDSIWSEYLGRYIPDHECAYCEDIGDYLDNGNATWLDYKGIYVSDECELNFSEYDGNSYLIEDTVHSDILGDDIYNELAIKIKVSETSTDYVPKDLTKLYFKLKDDFYSIDYIKDPYGGGEYIWIKDKQVSKDLESKLNKEFEKYNINGRFQLDDFKKDLVKLLMQYKITDNPNYRDNKIFIRLSKHVKKSIKVFTKINDCSFMDEYDIEELLPYIIYINVYNTIEWVNNVRSTIVEDLVDKVRIIINDMYSDNISIKNEISKSCDFSYHRSNYIFRLCSAINPYYFTPEINKMIIYLNL